MLEITLLATGAAMLILAAVLASRMVQAFQSGHSRRKRLTARMRRVETWMRDAGRRLEDLGKQSEAMLAQVQAANAELARVEEDVRQLSSAKGQRIYPLPGAVDPTHPVWLVELSAKIDDVDQIHQVTALLPYGGLPALLAVSAESETKAAHLVTTRHSDLRLRARVLGPWQKVPVEEVR